MEIAIDGNDRVRTVTEPAPVVSSTRADISPQFSPDGKRIVFGSDRDGFREIWVSDSDGSNPAQLTALKSPRCGSPHWSPDGRQIVFDSLASGNNDIWMVGSEGGPPKRLTTEPSDDGRPSWSHDGLWIYFRSDRSGSPQIWKIPSSEPYRPAVQVTRNGAFDAIESVDGKLLYFVKTGPGLWSMPVEGGDETPIDQPVMAGNWAVAGNGVYYLDIRHRLPDGGVPIQYFGLATRKPVQVGVLHKVQGGSTPTLTVTRDGHWIAWAQLDHQDSDLMLIENFR
jgi:Tol biopolymer transport system component